MSRSLSRLSAAGFFTTFYLVFNKTSNLVTAIIVPSFKHAFSKTLRFLSSSMDNFFTYQYPNDDVFGPDPPSSPLFSPYPSSSSSSSDALFLVPFKWWSEVREALYSGGGGEEVVDGVLYNAASSTVSKGDPWEDEEVETEILLELTREGKTESGEEGVSGGGGDGDLALISEWMFLRALKWHDDIKNVEILLADQDGILDLFSLQIRLSCVGNADSLIIRICEKINEIGAFKRSRSIFGTVSGLMQVWDFSGQMNEFLANEQQVLKDLGQTEEEISLELQVYGFSSCNFSRENGNDEMTLQRSKIEATSSSSSLMMNGHAEHIYSYSLFKQPPPMSSFGSGYVLGLAGLFNLGNTCFMNSALQCLAHTTKIVDYFLGNFRKDLNIDNPLGMNGKLAIAFGELLRKLWFPGASPVAPRVFKSAIAAFAPQFSGYNQHDSQEFLAFLLDGLHEDLNRVKCKLYIETKDGDGRPDEEVADEHWQNHLTRNGSIIVDLCHGQYRSTLVCPVCLKKSITFDPFMYLSLPLPSTTMRTMTLTILSSDGTTLPFPVTVTVPNNGTFRDLVQALSSECALRDDETLLVAEVFNNRVINNLDKPSDSLELIRDSDVLVAYRMLKDEDNSALFVFSHIPEKSFYGKHFGIPLVTKMSNISKGSELREVFLKLLSPFLIPVEESLDDYDSQLNTSTEDAEMVDVDLDGDASFNSQSENTVYADNDFQFYTKAITPLQMDEPVPIPKDCTPVQVEVRWTEKAIEKYDLSCQSSLPEVFKPTLMSKIALDSVSLDECLNAFLKEEPLGPEDMWYCPNCKKHQQASKKLDLWRLPEILVIHLKRFSYNRYFKNKLETFVNFPIDEFDLTSYILHTSNKFLDRYTLYAVSNHYGGMGGGHYTALAQHKRNNWYEFDDQRVSPIKEEQIKSPAAYVLFYKRISDA